MKLILPRFSIVFILFSLLIVAGCKTASTQNYATVPNPDFQYSFNKAPFISPRIVQDLSTWISDKGDQVVAINVLDSQNSNRYFGDAEVRRIESQNPYIFMTTTNVLNSETNNTEFGYQYVGETSSGVYVLLTSDWEGGSGNFKNLLLVTFEYDKSINTDWDKKIVRWGNRLLIKKLGEIALGDRWDGKLAVNGNSIVIGDRQLKLTGFDRR
jgi:hypothetical protein